MEYKQLAFKTVLMDSWYATKDIMLTIDSLDKIFYCLSYAEETVQLNLVN